MSSYKTSKTMASTFDSQPPLSHEQAEEKMVSWKVLFIVFLMGLAFRCLVATLGGNYDMESWVIVSEAVIKGENPYATYRFNYAPTSAYLLGGLRWLHDFMFGGAEDAFTSFHIFLVVFLSFIDLFIAMLLRRFNSIAALVYLLHPAVILLTGFHSQLEPLGVLFLLLASFSLFRQRMGWGIFFLVLSLQMKHVAIFFPIWLLFRSEFSGRDRFLLLSFPIGLFMLSFQPFLMDPTAREALRELTLNHSSFHLSSFWATCFNAFVPVSGLEHVGAKLGLNDAFKFTFFGVVFMMGYMLRRVPLTHLPLYYLLIFTVFASGISDQYLAIPMVFAAVYWRNPFTFLFGLVTFVLLCSSHYNLGGLPEMLTVNRTVRGLGWMRWHGLAWLFLDLVWRSYEAYRTDSLKPYLTQLAFKRGEN